MKLPELNSWCRAILRNLLWQSNKDYTTYSDLNRCSGKYKELFGSQLLVNAIFNEVFLQTLVPFLSTYDNCALFSIFTFQRFTSAGQDYWSCEELH